MNLSPEERKRRAMVIRLGEKEEYWNLIKTELTSIMEMKKKEALSFMAKHESDKASECSNVAEGLRIAIGCPTEILKAHDNIFNKLLFETCHTCGNLIQKIKKIVS